ncbi:unnamed protein product [Discosporangium mesarthrocarpum]
MCQSSTVKISGVEREAAVLSWKTGWVPSVVVVGGSWVCGYGSLEGWPRSMVVFMMFEVLRVTAVGLLPLWWKKVAGRTEPPTTIVRESFGAHAVSLLLSTYLIGHVLLWDWHVRTKVPFWHTPGKDHTGMATHLMEIMAMYLVHDTWHLLRTWRFSPNWVMLLHHAVFTVVCMVGLTYKQVPQYVRIHGILFSAEASTPLLNLRWVLRNVFRVKKSSLVMSVVSGLFAVLFVVTRVFMYSLLIWDLWVVHEDLIMPRWVSRLFVVVVTISYLINLHWFSIISRTTLGMVGSAKDRGDAEKKDA